MAQRPRPAIAPPPPPGSLPCDDQTWRRVSSQLALAPQQERIVELILRQRRDGEIAEELGLTVPTVRTYLSRVFDRLGVGDRLSLTLYIWSLTRSDADSHR